MPPAELPPSAALLRDFANTLNVEEATDALDGTAAAAAWLRENGLLLPGTALGEAELRELLALRAALRRQFLANHDGVDDAGALAELNRLAQRAPLRALFEIGASASLQAAGAGTPAAALVAAVFESMRLGSWRRLKVCRSDDCQWAFFDSSKNRSGTWCSMAVCGNRSKVRAYQSRRRAAGHGGAD